MISLILALLLQAATAPGIVPATLAKAITPLSPPNAVAGACVLAGVSVDPKGRVGEIKIVRGLGPFNDSVTTAIKQWEFTGAMSGSNGERVASRVGVLTVFRPASFGNQGLGGPTFGYKEPTSVGKSHPPYPRTFKDPGYPQTATTAGVVIIEVTIDKLGKPSNMRTVQDVPSLTNLTRDAIQSWIFMPAMDAGRPADGTLIVAISFVRPVIITN